LFYDLTYEISAKLKPFGFMRVLYKTLTLFYFSLSFNSFINRVLFQ